MQNAGKEEALNNGAWPAGDTMIKMTDYFDQVSFTTTGIIQTDGGGHRIVLQWIHGGIAASIRR